MLSDAALEGGARRQLGRRHSHVESSGRWRRQEGRHCVYEVFGVLGPSITRFVESHVRSLLTWDILVFFDRNPETELDETGLASRLGRHQEEIGPEVEVLCDAGILQSASGLIRYEPTPELREQVGEFTEACQDRGRRLALIALVLQRISRPATD